MTHLFAFFASFGKDLRYAARTLRRTPSFTLAVVLSLAFAMGVNTAIFILIDGVMLRRLPVRNPEELVEPLHRYPGEPRMNGFSWRSYDYFRSANHVFQGLIGFAPANFEVRMPDSGSETVPGEYVTGNYFPLLGVNAAAGRMIGAADENGVAVISQALWDRAFHRDPAAIGKQIVVNGAPVTIVGIAPEEFRGLAPWTEPDIWTPAGRITQSRAGLILAARLKPGISMEQARAEMAVLFRFSVDELTAHSRDPLLRKMSIELEPAGTGLSQVRDFFAKPLLALIAVASLLLLVACANIACLFLARGSAMQRETAVRVALGAARMRLFRQVFAEALLISAVGSIAGLGMGYVGAGTLLRVISSGRLPPGFPRRIHLAAEPDAHIVLYTAAVALGAAILFGAAPAMNRTAAAPAMSLRDMARSGQTKLSRVFAASLVIAQVALSMLLLSAAGTFVRYLSNLKNVDLGFRRDHVLLMTLDVARAGYSREQLAETYRRLLARIDGIPGVQAATVCAPTPISGAGTSRFVTVEGRTERAEDRRYVSLSSVGPKYFETLGTPLIAGRDFTFEDAGRPRVAIINRAFARYYFGDANPVGRRVLLDGDEEPYEIVGFAGDAKYSDLHEPAPRTLYLNAFQARRMPSQFAIRASVNSSYLAREIRRTVNEIAEPLSVMRIVVLDEQIEASIVPERIIAGLSSCFGMLGALLAGLGLYGLMAYGVARRANEIGIRMALGASEGAIARMVLRGALRVACAGAMIGAPIAVVGAWLMQSVFRDVSSNVVAAEPLMIGVSGILAVALAAAYFPARRAMRIDPAESLRRE